MTHIRLFLIACFFFHSTAASAASETAWKMVQKEKWLGTQTINFASNGVKIVNAGRGFSIVSKAPDWDVVLYREDDKIFCRLKRQQYYNSVAFRVSHGHTPGKVLKIYTIGPVTAPMHYTPYHNDVIKRFENVPVEVEDMLSSYFRANCVDGIVLRSVSNSIGKSKADASVFMPIDMGGIAVLRETLSLNKVAYNPLDFQVPKNLRPVNDIKQITTGKAKRKEAESIFLDMGVGDELGVREQRRSN
ncbi:MAG TPA: hypothetical protein PKZ32_08080 [Candidatus Melainabacteria bacterium]|nr:hypothetical protein [Candidatus Melainabacteria bacterium]